MKNVSVSNGNAVIQLFFFWDVDTSECDAQRTLTPLSDTFIHLSPCAERYNFLNENERETRLYGSEQGCVDFVDTQTVVHVYLKCCMDDTIKQPDLNVPWVQRINISTHISQ